MAFILLHAQQSNENDANIGLELSIINGQPMLTFEDSTRSNKRISVAEQSLTFAENKLGDRDWIQIGNATHANSGYTVDFDGTVVYATGHCENTGGNSKEIHLFVNGVDCGSIGTIIGGSDATFINTTLDEDFGRGDILRLQAQNGSGGDIQDTVIKLAVKWRA